LGEKRKREKKEGERTGRKRGKERMGGKGQHPSKIHAAALKGTWRMIGVNA